MKEFLKSKTSIIDVLIIAVLFVGATVGIGLTQPTPDQQLGATIPTPVALFETTLASSISSTATSMTLTSATDKDGNTLATSTYAFIIDEGTASEEFVIATCTGTSCTSMTRGVSVLTGNTSVTDLKKAHRRGASVKITDGPQLLILSRILNGDETLPNIISYNSNPSFSSGSNELASVKFAEDLANAGCANASETVLGCAELTTAAEALAGTTTGSTGARLVLSNATATSTNPAAGGWSVLTNASGYINQALLDLTEAFDFGSASTFELPNGATGTTTTFGQIFGDNNAWASSRGALQFFDGTANTFLVGALASDTPTDGQVPTWNTGGTVTWETTATTGESDSFFAPCYTSSHGITGLQNGATYISFPDATDTSCYGSFYMPSSGTINSMQYVLYGGNDPGNNILIDLSFQTIADGATESDSATGDVIGDALTNVPMIDTATSTAYDGLTRGRLWTYTLTRDGNGAGDTAGGTNKASGILVNITQ